MMINLVRLEGWSILRQLRLEEALLRHDSRNWCLVNFLTGPATVVLGMNGKPEALVNRELVERDGVAMIRRFTGGGTVVVGVGTVTAALVLNKADAPCESFPRPIMDWTGDLRVYSPIFHRLCGEPILSLRENDYVVDGAMKVGGNAQSIIKDRWIHHTSFLYDFADADMAYLALPEKRPQYRGDRPHAAFVARLAPRLTANTTKTNGAAGFAVDLGDELCAELGSRYRVSEVTKDVAARVVLPDWSGKSQVGRIALLIAMEEEAAPMIEVLQLTRREANFCGAPTVVHEGEYKGAYVAVVNPGRDKTGVNLIGTDAAALTTFLAARELEPDLLINAGTCGGFKRTGGSIGDVFCVSSFRHHDRRIAIPGYDEFGVACRQALPTPNLVETLGLKTGPCTTGNSLDFVREDDERMHASAAVAKDMEGASIAWAAHIAGDIPLIGIKVVTDIVDGDKPTHEEFLHNLQAAAASLQSHVPKVIDFVANKHITDL
ncbi:hypothetical protein CTAYLR_003692 [Chrysophaeum taylorii]|uniref:BPL/LPL catalytic domain-containing protein n=1 Tax=Chrysophaeum taylorii TaxID=2483200 RepID=A0AAD7XMQ9_9STRA|nr:hypothetical protein CTAYLR_003692 [Chrysophaeum taylorii]